MLPCVLRPMAAAGCTTPHRASNSCLPEGYSQRAQWEEPAWAEQMVLTPRWALSLHCSIISKSPVLSVAEFGGLPGGMTTNPHSRGAEAQLTTSFSGQVAVPVHSSCPRGIHVGCWVSHAPLAPPCDSSPASLDMQVCSPGWWSYLLLSAPPWTPRAQADSCHL